MMMDSGIKKIDIPKLILKYKNPNGLNEYYLDWRECDEYKERYYNYLFKDVSKLKIKNYGVFIPVLNDDWDKDMKSKYFKLSENSVNEYNHYRKLAQNEYLKERGANIALECIHNLSYFLVNDNTLISNLGNNILIQTIFKLKILTHIHPLSQIGEDSEFIYLNADMYPIHKEFKKYYAERYAHIVESYTELHEDSIEYKRRKRLAKLNRIKNFIK